MWLHAPPCSPTRLAEDEDLVALRPQLGQQLGQQHHLARGLRWKRGEVGGRWRLAAAVRGSAAALRLMRPGPAPMQNIGVLAGQLAPAGPAPGRPAPQFNKVTRQRQKQIVAASRTCTSRSSSLVACPAAALRASMSSSSPLHRYWRQGRRGGGVRRLVGGFESARKVSSPGRTEAGEYGLGVQRCGGSPLPNSFAAA